MSTLHTYVCMYIYVYVYVYIYIHAHPGRDMEVNISSLLVVQGTVVHEHTGRQQAANDPIEGRLFLI
jgi:hypothetical protein